MRDWSQTISQENPNKLQSFDKAIIGLFFISFVNSLTLLAFLAVLCFYFQSKVQGAVKILFWITTRGILSSVVAIPFSGPTQYVKYILLFAASGYILFAVKIKGLPDYRKLKSVLSWLVLFSLYTSIVTFFNSSYPTTSIFKVLSFSVPFAAVLVGVAATYLKISWMHYMGKIITILFALSLVMLPFDRFRIVNNDFQGIFNHVNICGIIAALYISILLYTNRQKKTVWFYVWLLLVIIMEYSTKSRTGMLIMLLCILVGFLVSKQNIALKLISLICGILLLFIFVFVFKDQLSGLFVGINDFLYKGNAESIMGSRESLLEMAMLKFDNHPVLGAGFMVPYHVGFRTFSFSFDLIAEPGNLFWSLLGDTGVIGLILFVSMMMNILLRGYQKNLILFVAAMGVTLGEMVFFSSNNMAILLYLMIGVYLFEKPADLAKGEEEKQLHQGQLRVGKYLK